MKLTRTFYSTCIFLCALFSISAPAATGKADSLFQLGAFREASIEYDRLLYSSENSTDAAFAILGKVECLKQTGRYLQAKNLLTDVPANNLPDSLHVRIRYQSALCAYLAGDFSLAESELKLLATMHPGRVTSQEAGLLNILVLNEKNDYTGAASLLPEYITGLGWSRQTTDSLILAANRVYHRKNLPRIVKPQRATILSVFLPGLGQAYAGYPGEGLISLAVNLSSIGIMVVGGINSYYITGYVAGAGLFQKFYFGGQTRAEYLARRHNYLSSRAFNQKAKEFLLSVQKK